MDSAGTIILVDMKLEGNSYASDPERGSVLLTTKLDPQKVQELELKLLFNVADRMSSSIQFCLRCQNAEANKNW